jgi:hypothetical protein
MHHAGVRVQSVFDVAVEDQLSLIQDTRAAADRPHGFG